MILKRLFCVSAAALTACMCMATSVFADAEEEEKVIIPFEADEEMLSDDDSSPAVSFDTSDWEKYVHVSPDGEAMGIKIKQDTDTYYQGASLKIYSDSEGMKDKDKYYGCADGARDADGNLLYPKASEEDAVFFNPGVELRAEDFGLSCFDGCMITFTYRMGTDTEDKLMENSVYVYAVDGDYERVSDMATKLTYNVVDNDNVSQYRKLMLSIAQESGATRIIFETPVLKKIDSDILYLDNIGIMTSLKDGDKNLYVKNLDGFNKNAKPQEIINEIQIKEKGKEISVPDSPKEEKSSFNPIIIVIVILGGGIVALVVVLVMKHRNKFY